jgi:hypothetical protein
VADEDRDNRWSEELHDIAHSALGIVGNFADDRGFSLIDAPLCPAAIHHDQEVNIEPYKVSGVIVVAARRNYKEHVLHITAKIEDCEPMTLRHVLQAMAAHEYYQSDDLDHNWLDAFQSKADEGVHGGYMYSASNILSKHTRMCQLPHAKRSLVLVADFSSS